MTYCPGKCRADVVPNRRGECPWCREDLSRPVPRSEYSMQVATMATTLQHLTIPKERPE